MAVTETKEMQAYKDHVATCKTCQDHSFCQVAHDLLLKECGYQPRKEEKKNETILR